MSENRRGKLIGGGEGRDELDAMKGMGRLGVRGRRLWELREDVIDLYITYIYIERE